MLKGRKILLGVTGGIAAYKAANIIRLLVKQGAEVKVVMTAHAKEFITPLTLATLSKNPILVDFFDPEDGRWNSHVELGLWSDLYLIAPATANTIGKMAAGIADNLLLTSYLSARCPVFIAPAMDLDMLKHPATQENINTLRKYGNIIIEPAIGELASGLTGKGRMEEPEVILEKLVGFFETSKSLLGKKFLVTAGPTYEKIDAVRFIGNYSSGKMGYAIAESLAENGAEVILVSGPVAVATSNRGIQVIHVESAEEMHQHAVAQFPACQGAVLCAAVADFKPEKKNDKKIKSGAEEWLLKLKPTHDIAAILGEMKAENQVLAGFALETDHEIENAIEKRKRKNFDFIVLNSLNDAGAGFRTQTNKITIIGKDNIPHFFELKTKAEVATDIVNKIKMLVS